MNISINEIIESVVANTLRFSTYAVEGEVNLSNCLEYDDYVVFEEEKMTLTIDKSEKFNKTDYGDMIMYENKNLNLIVLQQSGGAV